MKTVADTLGVARSNLVERRQGHHRSRGRYHKNDDDVLAAQIRKLIDQRPGAGPGEPTTVWSSPCVRICVGAQIISNWRAVTSKLSAFCSQLMLAIGGSWPGPRPQPGSPGRWFAI